MCFKYLSHTEWGFIAATVADAGVRIGGWWSAVLVVDLHGRLGRLGKARQTRQHRGKLITLIINLRILRGYIEVKDLYNPSP